ncbi:MAG: ferrous iron transport protein B, partial [Verrucomicrobia bacterium]
LLEVSERCFIFLKRAGTIILATSIIFWFLTAYPQTSTLETPQLYESYIGMLGKLIEPLIIPLGFDWKIGIGLLTSFAARELFISTLTIINNGTSFLLSPLSCISLIIFFIYAMQCVSTLAVVKRETNSWKWPIFQFLFMTTFAYIASFTIYQLGILLSSK